MMPRMTQRLALPGNLQESRTNALVLRIGLFDVGGLIEISHDEFLSGRYCARRMYQKERSMIAESRTLRKPCVPNKLTGNRSPGRVNGSCRLSGFQANALGGSTRVQSRRGRGSRQDNDGRLQFLDQLADHGNLVAQGIGIAAAHHFEPSHDLTIGRQWDFRPPVAGRFDVGIEPAPSGVVALVKSWCIHIEAERFSVAIARQRR